MRIARCARAADQLIGAMAMTGILDPRRGNAERLVHQPQRVLRAHALDADAIGECLARRVGSRQHADVIDGAPGDSERWEARAAATPGQAFKVGVSRDVDALSGGCRSASWPRSRV